MRFLEVALAMLGAVGLLMLGLLAYLLYIGVILAAMGIFVGGFAAVVWVTVRFVLGLF